LGLVACVLCAAVMAGRPPLSAQATPSLDIHYVPTPMEVVDAMLTGAAVTGSDLVYDLGSGDGRIVIEAARRFGARGVGIELDPMLVKRARENARKAGVEDRVSFMQADLFKTDLSKASVVTLYLSPSINLRLESKLRRELKPGSRIVSHRFPIGTWMPEREVTVGSNHVLFWTVP
jgi:SAM-dependent methyltransferase